MTYLTSQALPAKGLQVSLKKRLKTALLLVALPLTSLSLVAEAAQEQRGTEGASLVSTQSATINLAIGKGQLIRLDRPAKSVFVADENIADIQVKSPRLIYIMGKAGGETSFFALDSNDATIYSAEVAVSRNLGQLTKAIESLVPSAEVRLTTFSGMIMVQGRVASPDEAASVERIIKGMAGVTSVLNRLEIMQPTQVNLRVRIAEVSRTSIKQLGVRWESIFSGVDGAIGLATGSDAVRSVISPITDLPVSEFITTPGQASNYFGRLSTGNLDLNAVIDALGNEGLLTVLAEPNLTAVTGEEADFLAGGEFPVPIPTQNGIAIEYRKFGVSLNFKPTVLNSGRITLAVEPEVSNLSDTGAIRVEGISIPSITTRRAKTTVELGSGQSFAIAGLLQNETVKNASKLPGLGDIPILGALFRSKRFERNETELLIVVTPYLVNPVSDRRIALPTDGYVNPSDMDYFLKNKSWKTRAQKKDQKDKQKEGPSLKKRAGFQID